MMIAAANTYCTSTSDMSLVQDDKNSRSDDLYHHMLAQVQVSPADLEGDGITGYDDPDIYKDHEEMKHISSLTTEDNSHST